MRVFVLEVLIGVCPFTSPFKKKIWATRESKGPTLPMPPFPQEIRPY